LRSFNDRIKVNISIKSELNKNEVEMDYKIIKEEMGKRKYNKYIKDEKSNSLNFSFGASTAGLIDELCEDGNIDNKSLMVETAMLAGLKSLGIDIENLSKN
jgi:hypothetical protein